MGNRTKIRFEYFYHSVFDRSSELNPEVVRKILDDFFAGSKVAYSLLIYDLLKEPKRAHEQKVLITPSFIVFHDKFNHKFVANKKTLSTMLTSILQLVKSSMVKQSADGLLGHST